MTQPRRRSGIVGLLVRPDGYVSGPQVLSELRRVIASGQVPPGSPIPLDDVAAFFGVSLIPVREALKTLLGEGLLDHQPRLGYTVTQLSPAEIDELYVVRGALEAAALDAAVRNAGTADHERAAQEVERVGVGGRRAECARGTVHRDVWLGHAGLPSLHGSGSHGPTVCHANDDLPDDIVRVPDHVRASDAGAG